MSNVSNAAQLDEGKLNAFVGQMLNDLGGASSIAMVRIGDALGLYKELHARGPMTSSELAYEDSCSACVEPGLGFFGFNALRFIVAVMAVLAVLAFTSASDLDSVSDAAARSLGDREPPLK